MRVFLAAGTETGSQRRAPKIWLGCKKPILGAAVNGSAGRKRTEMGTGLSFLGLEEQDYHLDRIRSRNHQLWCPGLTCGLTAGK